MHGCAIEGLEIFGPNVDGIRILQLVWEEAEWEALLDAENANQRYVNCFIPKLLPMTDVLPKKRNLNINETITSDHP